jgi:DNA polymerase-3 subunit epsilon
MNQMGSIASHTLAFLDVETTGLSPRFGDRICEIAVVRCLGEEILDSFDSLLNPERPLSPGAARVNGLRDADLIGAPRFSEVAGRVMALVKDSVIVCHNAPFDLGFLTSELGRIGHQLPTVLTLDTLRIARDHFNFDSNSLGSIASELRIDPGGAHRALDDTLTTREVLSYFARKLGSTEIEHAILPYYPPATSSQQLDLPPVIEEALESKRRLFIRYVDVRGETSERWITPTQVLASADYLYLVAHCHLRDGERHFRLDRIESIVIEQPPR